MDRQIGDRIRQCRQAQCLSQQDLADALQVSRQTVSNYELGTTAPSVEMLKKIADALKVDPAVLLCEREPEIHQSPFKSRFWIKVTILALIWTVLAVCHAVAGRYDYAAVMLLWNGLFRPCAMVVSGWIVSDILRRIFGRTARYSTRAINIILHIALIMILALLTLETVNVIGRLFGEFTFGNGFGRILYQIITKSAPVCFAAGSFLHIFSIHKKTSEKQASLWQYMVSLSVIILMITLTSIMPANDPVGAETTEMENRMPERS